VYRYGPLAPLDWAENCDAELRRQNNLWNRPVRVYDGTDMRAEWALTARRLRRMALAFDKKAITGLDCAAAVVAIKASERRATLTGANAPPSHLVTIMHQQVSEEQPTSTQKMLDAIRRLRGETDDGQGL